MGITIPKNNFLEKPIKNNTTNIELSNLEIKVYIDYKKEIMIFYIGNEAIGKVEFSSNKKGKIDEILYIGNLVKNKYKNIKGIGTYMVKYILENFVEDKLTIWNISKILFYDKLVEKLLKKGIIKKYNFSSWKDETNLILYKK